MSKGQLMIVSIMVAVVIFLFAMIITPVIRDSVSSAQNESYFNATSPNYTVVNQVTGTIMDVGFIFYFIASIIATGLAYVTGKPTITRVLGAITIFIVVILLITPLKDFIVTFRDADHLNCADTTISTGTKMTCLFVDLWLFYFVIVSISAGISYIFLTSVIRGDGG